MLDVPTITGVLRKGAALRPIVDFLKAAGPYPGDALGDALGASSAYRWRGESGAGAVFIGRGTGHPGTAPLFGPKMPSFAPRPGRSLSYRVLGALHE